MAAIFSDIAERSTGGPEYGYTDATPHPGVNYYRLRMTGDAGAEWSVVRPVSFSTFAAPTLAPNTATSELRISGISGGGEGSEIEVCDAGGRLIYHAGIGDERELRIALTGWPAGIYYLSRRNEQGVIPAPAFQVR